MVKKKYILTLCLCFSMFTLAGCVKVTELNEEEQDIIAEYSAGILLQHDAKYSRKLLKSEATVQPAVTAAPTLAAEPTQSPQSSGTKGEETEPEETVNEVTLNELYGVKGMNVTYNSYTICKEYPKKSSSFQLTSKKGERLLVVRFKVKNTSSKPMKINLIQRKISYPLDLDGTVYEPTIVIQKNGGLNYLKTNLKAGASEEAVLVYEIPEEAVKPAAITLTAQDGDNASILRIKEG